MNRRALLSSRAVSPKPPGRVQERGPARQGGRPMFFRFFLPPCSPNRLPLAGIRLWRLPGGTAADRFARGPGFSAGPRGRPAQPGCAVQGRPVVRVFVVSLRGDEGFAAEVPHTGGRQRRACAYAAGAFRRDSRRLVLSFILRIVTGNRPTGGLPQPRGARSSGLVAELDSGVWKRIHQAQEAARIRQGLPHGGIQALAGPPREAQRRRRQPYKLACLGVPGPLQRLSLLPPFCDQRACSLSDVCATEVDASAAYPASFTLRVA